MKTEYREHPLGTPGLSVRLAEPEREAPPRPGAVRRFVQAVARRLRSRSR